jgi:broad specificity phosphatase PhoE
MRTLLLIRHLETDLKGTFCGHSDPPLNDAGLRALAGLLKAVSNSQIERIVTSELLRARQTAEAIANRLGVSMEARPNLREINFGRWEGLTWGAIERDFPAEARSWAADYPNSTAPGGERFADFELRVLSEMEYLLEQAVELQIAVVTHAGFMRVALYRCFGVSTEEAWKMSIPYGAVVRVVSRKMTTLKSFLIETESLSGVTS